MPRILALFCIFLLFPSTSFAGAWRWTEGQTRRYLLQARYDAPWVLPVDALANADGIAAGLAVTVVVQCSPVRPPRGKVVELDCTVEDASFWGVPFNTHERALSLALASWEEVLERVHLSIVLHESGRVQTFTITRFDRANNRQGEMIERMRGLLKIAVGALEVTIPPDGIPAEPSAWQSVEPIALQIPNNTGTGGGGERVVEFAGRQQFDAVLRFRGERITPVYDERSLALTWSGTALWSDVLGELVRGAYRTTGHWTAGSSIPRGVEYLVTGHAIRLGPNDTVTLYDTALVGARVNDIDDDGFRIVSATP